MFGSESGVVEHSIIHAKSPIMCLPLHPAILGNMFKNCGRESFLALHLKDKPVPLVSVGGHGNGSEPLILEVGALLVESRQGDLRSVLDLRVSRGLVQTGYSY